MSNTRSRFIHTNRAETGAQWAAARREEGVVPDKRQSRGRCFVFTCLQDRSTHIKASRIITIPLLIFLMTCGISGSDIYSLYTDHRAMKQDDILTVIIVENAKAGSKSSTNTKKKNSFGIDNKKGTGPLDFIPSFGASGGVNLGFDGEGGTKREGSLVATISARVTKVLDNGNLVISGSKIVEINEEKEIIKISGVVRPEDIESNNTIYSYNISDADITYSGKGIASTGQRPGFFARVFNWLF